MKVRAGRLLLVVLLVGLGLGCGSGGLRLPTDAAGTALFEQAEEAVADGDWSKAAEAYDMLLRNYPTSPHLADARLGLGRARYEQRRSDTLLLAAESFRNFLTYHPSHEQVDYAQLMIALSYQALMRSPDRDQTNTRRALAAFEDFLEDHPNSQYREIALEHMRQVIDTLALHELQVAQWQLGRGYYAAAEARCQYALRKYPQTSHRCDLLYTLAESLRERDDLDGAAVYYERLVQDHPQCARAADARRRLNRISA